MPLIRLDPLEIIAAREAAGLSRDELAERAEISRVTLWKIETGLNKHGCQAGIARSIAEALGVDLDQIAEGPPVRHTRPDKRRTA